MDELLERASSVDETLRVARRAWLMWDARRREGWRVADTPPPEASLGPDDEREAREAAIALCDGYRAGDAADRTALRSGLAPLADVAERLQGLLFEAAHRVTDTGEAAWLERGLAAAALLGEAVDRRDTIVGVGRLQEAANGAHLDFEAARASCAPPPP